MADRTGIIVTVSAAAALAGAALLSTGRTTDAPPAHEMTVEQERDCGQHVGGVKLCAPCRTQADGDGKPTGSWIAQDAGAPACLTP